MFVLSSWTKPPRLLRSVSFLVGEDNYYSKRLQSRPRTAQDVDLKLPSRSVARAASLWMRPVLPGSTLTPAGRMRRAANGFKPGSSSLFLAVAHRLACSRALTLSLPPPPNKDFFSLFMVM